MKFNKAQTLSRLDDIERSIRVRKLTLDQSTAIYRMLQDLHEKLDLYVEVEEIPWAE